MARLVALSVGLLSLAAACGGGEGPEATPAIPFEQVTFTTQDGLTLSGRLFGQGEVFIVLAHMFPADQGSWTDFAGELAEEGYSALTFDFRGYGKSEGKKEIDKIDRDVLSALEFARSHGASRVFLVGASMGGTASLKVAARGEVTGVVTLSAPTEFRGLDARDDIGEVQEPKLLVASRGDGSAFRSAEFFFGNAQEPKEQLTVEGSAHGTNILKGNEKEEVEEAILGFIQRYK